MNAPDPIQAATDARRRSPPRRPRFPPERSCALTASLSCGNTARSVNPRTIQWQAIITGVLLITVTVLSSPVTTFGRLAATGLALALFLNATYAHALGSRGRCKRRIQGDRRVVGDLAIAFGAPIVVSTIFVLDGKNASFAAWRFTTAETSALLVTAATLFDLLSSLVDWYYIRPRIDGVVWESPCRSSGQPRWKRVTRRWYLHRGLATVAYIVFALTIALIIMLMLVRENPAAAGVIGGVSGIAGLLLDLPRRPPPRASDNRQVRAVTGVLAGRRSPHLQHLQAAGTRLRPACCRAGSQARAARQRRTSHRAGVRRAQQLRSRRCRPRCESHGRL